jgi:hypothetical protein
MQFCILGIYLWISCEFVLVIAPDLVQICYFQLVLRAAKKDLTWSHLGFCLWSYKLFELLHLM